MTDPLASLPERPAVVVWLTDALRAAVAADHEVAVALVDVDAFGAVIETLGVVGSDDVLRTLAGRLQEAAERVGVRLARGAGDEFAVVLPEIADERAARAVLADLVAAAFGSPVSASGQTLYLTASTAVALSPPSDPQELLRRAIVELGRVKATGGGRISMYRPQPSTAAHALALHADLHQAIENEQLVAYYQPIVDIAETRVVGMEAVVRWLHPERGVLAPVEFLPGITDTPLVDEIGTRMLRQACADMAAVATRVPELSYVGVNLAPRQLADPGLPDRVLGEVDAAGLDPHRLVLEVTEVARVESLAGARDVMVELRSRGVRIAMDNFGTGYSTLAALRQLPLDVVKIGRTFVEGLGHSDEDATVVASIASLATSLGMATVADGADTAEQAAAVLALGCRLAQGRRWSPPVALSELAATIERVNRDGHRPARRPRDLPGGPVEIRRIAELYRSGASAQTIAAALNRAGMQTAAGTRWHAAQVQRVIDADALADVPGDDASG